MINGYHWRWIVCLRIFLIILHDEYNDTCSCLLNLPLLLRLSPFVLWKGLHLVGKCQLHWWGSIACLYHMRSWSCVAFEKIRFTDFYCNTLFPKQPRVSAVNLYQNFCQSTQLGWIQKASFPLARTGESTGAGRRILCPLLDRICLSWIHTNHAMAEYDRYLFCILL